MKPVAMAGPFPDLVFNCFYIWNNMVNDIIIIELPLVE